MTTDPFDPENAERLANVSIREFCQLLQEGKPEPLGDYRGHAPHAVGTFATLALDLYSGKLQ